MGEYQYTIADWPVRSRLLAEDVVGRHGAPHTIRKRALEWDRSDGFRRMRVRDDGVLEQVVYYQVPSSKLADVEAFEGRLFVDFDEREVTAMAESEEMNLLMLNLMHDVMIGEKTPGQAWEVHNKVLKQLEMNWPEPYTRELHFHTDEGQLEI